VTIEPEDTRAEDDDFDEFGEVDIEYYPIPAALADAWDDEDDNGETA
jgi:hypothetical protein